MSVKTGRGHTFSSENTVLVHLELAKLLRNTQISGVFHNNRKGR